MNKFLIFIIASLLFSCSGLSEHDAIERAEYFINNCDSIEFKIDSIPNNLHINNIQKKSNDPWVDEDLCEFIELHFKSKNHLDYDYIRYRDARILVIWNKKSMSRIKFQFDKDTFSDEYLLFFIDIYDYRDARIFIIG